MKILFIFIFFVNFMIAEDKKVEVTNSELKLIVELIKLNQDTVNKRFEDMQKHMDKRFEQVDKRFEQVDKRFDNIFTLLSIILTAMVAGFGIIITYLIKDRVIVNSVQKDLKVEVEKIDNSLKKKADKNVVEKIIEIIERLAKDDKDIQDILKKHHLSYQS